MSFVIPEVSITHIRVTLLWLSLCVCVCVLASNVNYFRVNPDKNIWGSEFRGASLVVRCNAEETSLKLVV